jgi:hypothetical protein
VTTPQGPQIGDAVYLDTFFARINAYGVISDLDTPDMTSFTIEGSGGNGLLSIAALMGSPGPAGTNAPLLRQINDGVTDPANLPTNLVDDDVDNGKYWIIEDHDTVGNVIGSHAYLWNHDHYQVFMMGSPGPVGPVPIVTPVFQLVTPDVTATTHTTVTGDTFHPTWTTQINKELIRGPVGSAGPIRDAADYNNAVAPNTNDVITWNGTQYAPASPTARVTKFWTVPEASFTSNSTIGTRLQITSFQVPPLPWAWKPYVTGHIRAMGLTFSTDPLSVGAEVRLGDPTAGQVVARGFGNISTYAHIVPHFSTPGSPSSAATPENATGLVPANHNGTAGTLYVSLFNDGAFGDYTFDKTGAQLSIMAVPV